VVIWTLPAWWCRRGLDRWLSADYTLQRKLAATVERRVVDGVTLDHFHTGNAQFNGEWYFGSFFSSGLGFLQLAIADPRDAPRYVGLAERCIEKMLSPAVRKFDADSWGKHDPIDALGSDQDHVAFLGYFNLLLSLDRLVNPATKYAELNDRITAHLIARVEASKGLLLESYPSETYPLDNCTVIAGVALHQRATGADHHDLIARWTERCRTKWTDPKTGLLFQAWERNQDKPCDAPRGSGTAFGLYFLSFADARLSREFYGSLCRSLDDGLMSFGAFREYPRGMSGHGDIDSGPVVFGLSLSATGFGIAGAKMFDDRDRFARLYSSAVLAGAPVESGDAIQFTTGGPLGNALLFAMLTALPPEKIPQGEAAR
jgi:hypothetical protein